MLSGLRNRAELILPKNGDTPLCEISDSLIIFSVFTSLI